ncbi:hypothetical protein Pfo_017214 [Paulownia fortunei]|nr:hypothetical protein Pfo_017214 [Paulownia fortunei]
MSREYGGQWQSSTTRHVRSYAAYIDHQMYEINQTRMDKLSLILDPTDEFVRTDETCNKVYSYFQELAGHYEPPQPFSRPPIPSPFSTCLQSASHVGPCSNSLSFTSSTTILPATPTTSSSPMPPLHYFQQVRRIGCTEQKRGVLRLKSGEAVWLKMRSGRELGIRIYYRLNIRKANKVSDKENRQWWRTRQERDGVEMQSAGSKSGEAEVVEVWK